MKKLMMVVLMMFAGVAVADVPVPGSSPTTGFEYGLYGVLITSTLYMFTRTELATNFEDGPTYIKAGTNWTQHPTMTEYLSRSK